MEISKYLDSVEGTENEPMLIKGMLKLTEDESIAQLMDKPYVGHMFKALDALGNSENIADFKQTVHYENIKDWGITVFDAEKGFVSIYPGPKHLKKMLIVAAIAGAGLILLKLYKKNM
jgi:hypothetical protein